MSDHLIKGLVKLVKDGKKKGEIETELGMSKNSLASILTKKKPFPPKWIKPVEEYLNRGKPPEPKQVEKPKTATTMAELIKYCDRNGLNFDDLPNHVEKLTLELAASQKALNDLETKIAPLKFDESEINREVDRYVYTRIDKKDTPNKGKIKNQKDEYNPFANPQFNRKIGIKASDKKENLEG